MVITKERLISRCEGMILLLLALTIACLMILSGGTSADANSDFEYELDSDNKATITKYNGTDSIVEIPATLDGHTVIAIGTEAFMNNTTLTEVTIGGTVTTIDSLAFFKCTSLSKVTLTSGLVTIGDSAFEYCGAIETFSIPDTVTTLGIGALAKTGIKTITLGPNITSVGHSIFKECLSLTTVTDNSKVTEINGYAYENCSSLVTVNIPATVTYIGLDAFNGCSSLTTISLPSNLTGIWHSAFEGTGIESIVIPATVTEIGREAFMNCTKLRTVTLSEGCTLNDSGSSAFANTFKGCTSLESIVIPASITALVDGMFIGCTGLESVTFADGTQLTDMGKGTFEGCESLAGISIPDGVTSLKEHLFKGCSSLETVTINPASLITNIGNGVFEGCAKLKSMYIPKNVGKNLPAVIFKGCTSLTSFTVHPDNVNYRAIDGVLYGTKSSTVGEETVYTVNRLIKYPAGKDGTSYAIQSGIESIDYAAFYDYSLTTVDFSGTLLTTLSDGLLANNTNLTTVTFSKTTDFVSPSVFEGCTSLTTFIVEEGSTNMKVVDGVLLKYDGTYLYKYPAGKTDTFYKVPATVERISDYAFQDTKLTAIDMSGSQVNMVPENFLKNHTYIQSVTLSAATIHVYNTAFYGCSALVEILVEDGGESYRSENGVLLTHDGSGLVRYPMAMSGTEYELPNTVKSIRSYAFQGCDQLVKIYITCRTGTMGVGDGAFADGNPDLAVFTTGIPECSEVIAYDSFEDGVFGNVVEDMINHNGTLYLKWKTGDNYITYDSEGGAILIHYDYEGTDISLPQTIGGGQLTGLGKDLFRNSELVKVTIPDSVRLFYDSVFHGCDRLRTVNIPASLLEVSEYAFYGCKVLESVTLPEGLTTVDKYAFYGCETLTEVTLPYSLGYLNEGAFEECVSLTNVTIIYKSGDSEKTNLYIGASAFEGCVKLLNVDLPNQMYHLGARAFERCVSLTEMDLPSVYSVADGLFRDCKGLVKVTIAEGTSSIGSGAFNGCVKLEKLHLPSTLSEIKYEAITGLLSLESITVDLDNSKFMSIDGVLYTKESSLPYQLYLYPSAKTDETYTMPESVTVVRSHAFVSNPYLKTANINGTVEYGLSCDDNIFYNYDSLENVFVHEDNPNYCDVDGVLFDKTKERLIKYPGSKAAETYTVPDGTRVLEAYSFMDVSKLKSLTLADSVVTIGPATFMEATSLTTLTLGSGLENIESIFGDEVYITTINLSVPTGGRNVHVTADSVEPFIDRNVLNVTNMTEGMEFLIFYLWADVDEDFDIDYVLSNQFYTLNLDSNNGSEEVKSERVPRDYAYTLSSKTFEHDHMYFIEWNTKADGTGTVYDRGDSVTNLADVGGVATLYAIWEPETYYLEFDPNGGQGEMYPQEFVYNVDQNLTANSFTRSGYLFNGWNTKADGTGTSFTDEQLVRNPCLDETGYRILYAQWVEPVYSVVFNANGGEGTMSEQKFELDVPQALNGNEFHRANHCFVGWNTKADGTEIGYDDKQVVENIAPMGGVVTLYAIWDPFEYKVRFDNNGGDGTMDDLTVKEGISATLPANEFIKEFHVFVAWNTESDGTGIAYNDEGTITVTGLDDGGILTLYAIWTTMEKVTITFENTGDSTIDPIVGYPGSAITPPGEPTKVGYTFSHWDPELPATMPTEDLTVTAVWDPAECVIVFLNTGDVVIPNIVALTGAQITAPEPPTWTGYTFKGWDKPIPSTMPAGGDTITATWEPITVRITFDFNYEGDRDVTSNFKFGQVIEFPDAPDRYGFELKAWTYDKDDADSKVPLDATVDFIENRTLYALWEPRMYEIRFLDYDGEIFETWQQAYGTVITAPTDPPVMPDDGSFEYAFYGWSGFLTGMKVGGDHTFLPLFIATPTQIAEPVESTVEVNAPVDVVDVTSFINDIDNGFQNGSIQTFNVVLNNGSIAMNGAAFGSIGTEADIGIVSTVNDAVPESISPKTQDRPVYNVFIGGVHTFDGTLTITFKYDLKPGEDANNIRIWHFDSNGNYVEESCTYDSEKGEVTFTTDNLSYFAVMHIMPEPDPEPGPGGDPSEGGLNIGIVIGAVMAAVAAVAVGAFLVIRGKR